MIEVVRCSYPFGEHTLSAFAVDPRITESELIEIVRTKDGTSKFNFARLSQDISLKATISSATELQVQVLDESYQVPEKLRAYREALEEKLTAEGKFNGPVAVLDRELGKSIRLRSGGYFDFMATKLEVVPASLVPDRYPTGTTIEQLMPEYGIKNEDRARFLGFAFLMLPQNGKEFQLVQRAKGMGIAADCISSSGSTPPFKEDFFANGFDFAKFYTDHIAQEMDEEFKMSKSEFEVRGGYIIDDKRTIPHIAWRVQTPLTTLELIGRIHGNQDSIKEHSVLYSMPPIAIPQFLGRFDVWPSVAYITNLFYADKVLRK